MRKRLGRFLLVFVLLLPLLTMTASADMGPKPSIVVNFKGLEGEVYYVTLLSSVPSTGPWSAENGDHGDAVAEKFSTYQDTDGFYFIGHFENCTESDTFRWRYYPPRDFKILLYFPEHDHFIVTADIYARYAFDSYYTVDAAGLDILSVSVAGDEMAVTRTYDYRWEGISLLCRVFITIAAELGVALLFGFRTKRLLLLIGVTNVVTQTVLNVLLNVINFHHGYFAFVFFYFWLELLVFGIEAAVYTVWLRRRGSGTARRLRPVLYAFSANALSFAAGMLVARWVPGIF